MPFHAPYNYRRDLALGSGYKQMRMTHDIRLFLLQPKDGFTFSRIKLNIRQFMNST